MSRPPVLIERWLPFEAIGAESNRENSTGKHPAPNRLHVWWARRPLIASRAAILASVLPRWSSQWPKELLRKFPDEESYHRWFIQLAGIRGDPVKGKKLVEWAKGKGIQLNFHPYGGAPRAFTVNPSAEDLQTMQELLEYAWGTKEISVLDPMAGGGSIPFEALRYGFTTFANDLNPVAAVILKATLEYPARFGPSLADDIRRWGDLWAKRVKEKLEPYFPKQTGENIYAYLWARTVACPSTGKPVPLSTNWWLSKEPAVAVRLVAEPSMEQPCFEIVRGANALATTPGVGTLSHGVARSPWTGETIDSGYIKAEAQKGRIAQILYAVALKKPGGFDFRIPTDEDHEAINRAENELDKAKPSWLAAGLIPTEQVPTGNDKRPLLYGINTWADFFTPRQLLSLGITLEALKATQLELQQQETHEHYLAIASLLGLVVSKCVDYNSRQTFWDTERGIRHAFSRHDFAFRWNSAEFDASGNLLPWAVEQVASAYSEISNIASPSQRSLLFADNKRAIDNLRVFQGSANNVGFIQDESLHNITVDPPYYDNVQYAELSDFFYVWLKRSVGHLFPEFFTDELTNKDDEAVANPARFEGMGKKKKELAERDYERKMAAAFKEMHRVLHDDGVLTVMFTHKRVEAWDTLASALIEAGFIIKASWPVHTESEHSLHQAKKNAAQSTILLACRKRDSRENQPVWWDDLKESIRLTARQKAEEFSAQGIRGVDLYISTFGPTLSILSEHWPVLTSEIDPKTGQPRPLRPETALDLAREEVVRLRKQGLLLGQAVQFDPVTDWYLMAWDAFKAGEFPYDEGRKLAIALGIDLDGELIAHKRLATKKGGFITLQSPTQRRKKNMVDEDLSVFPHWVDAVHTAMMVYQEDGPGACNAFLIRTGLKNDGTFKACLQAMLNAIPRARIKGKFARPEAETLENMRLAFFDDLKTPADEEPELPEGVQMELWKETTEADETDDVN